MSAPPQGEEYRVNFRAAIQTLSPAREDNPYAGDFSRRVAERLARLPERVEHGDFDDGEDDGLTWKVLGRSYKLLLTFVAGAILYGASLYPFLSELRSAGVSARPVAQPDR